MIVLGLFTEGSRGIEEEAFDERQSGFRVRLGGLINRSSLKRFRGGLSATFIPP